MTLSTFKRLFEEFQNSGLNIRDFCANKDFALSSFYYWKKKLEDTSQQQPDSFVPLVFDSKQLAVGRKGYLFCGNHESAENAAIMYSLLGCCKASDVNPREWLTDMFAKIASYNSNYDLDLADLLPHNWKKSNPCQCFPE